MVTRKQRLRNSHGCSVPGKFSRNSCRTAQKKKESEPCHARKIGCIDSRIRQGKVSRMHVLWSVIAASLIAAGLLGANVPALPGIPLIFGGLMAVGGRRSLPPRRSVVAPWHRLCGRRGVDCGPARRRFGCKARGSQPARRLGCSSGHGDRSIFWIAWTAAGAFHRRADRRTDGRQQYLGARRTSA